MKARAVFLFALGLIVLAYCFEFYRPFWRSDPFLVFRPTGNASADAGSDFWVYPGDQRLHFYKKVPNEDSIKGLRSVEELRADLFALGPTGTSLADQVYRVYENVPVRLREPSDTWDNLIELKQADVSEASINVDVEVESMPEGEDLWGRDARLLVSAQVSFPRKSGDEEYIDRHAAFRQESRFRFASRAEQTKYEAALKVYEEGKAEVDSYNARAEQIYNVTKALGYLIGIALIGFAARLFLRSHRQKTEVREQ